MTVLKRQSVCICTGLALQSQCNNRGNMMRLNMCRDSRNDPNEAKSHVVGV